MDIESDLTADKLNAVFDYAVKKPNLPEGGGVLLTLKVYQDCHLQTKSQKLPNSSATHRSEV